MNIYCYWHSTVENNQRIIWNTANYQIMEFESIMPVGYFTSRFQNWYFVQNWYHVFKIGTTKHFAVEKEKMFLNNYCLISSNYIELEH